MSQAYEYCSPNSSACYSTVVSQLSSSCEVSCTGLYADVVFEERQKQESQKVLSLYEKYYEHKRNYVKQIQFDPTRTNLGK